MSGFHVNPITGPIRCSALEGATCKPQSAVWDHYETKYEAYAAFTAALEAASKRFATYRAAEKHRLRKGLSRELVMLEESLIGVPYDNIVAYPTTKAKWDRLKTLVEHRAKVSPAAYERLLAADPEVCPDFSNGAYKVLKYDWSCYRDVTAVMIEALVTSEFYVPATEEYDITLPVGNAVPTSNFTHEDPNWYFVRYNSVGGSDVGTLAAVVFNNDPDSLEKLNLKKVTESKIAPPTLDTAQYSMDMSASRVGNLYRGTIWEDWIRDGFVKDHPELKVYKTKGQYTNNVHDWMRVNFDALISSREDGVPTGILEIKTGGVPKKWEGGIPLNYRAQTLYYLYATGLKEAIVRVVINDGDVRDFYLTCDDEVAPGFVSDDENGPRPGMTMEEWINEGVLPWFEGLKAQRKPVKKAESEDWETTSDSPELLVVG